MELEDKIVGLQLVEIQKSVDTIKLIFKDSFKDITRVLSFKGYLFETGITALNRKVKDANLRRALGFKAVTQLRYEHQDLSDYKQLLVEMEGSNDENKIELISVFKDFTIA